MKNVATKVFIALFFLYNLPVLFCQQGPGNAKLSYGTTTSNQFKIENLGAPKNTGIGVKYPDKASFWGVYFWEFGDGTYEVVSRIKEKKSATEYPTHLYTEKPQYPPSVFLTPFYSFDYVRNLVCSNPDNIRPVKSGQRTPPNMHGKLLLLETGSPNRIIPGNEMRVALNFEANVAGDGHLLVFYGGEKQLSQLGYKPLKFVPNSERFFHGETRNGTPFASFIDNQLASNPQAQAKARSILKNLPGGEVIVLNVPYMEAKDRHTVFFTLRSDERLKSNIQAGATLRLAAIWVPARAAFDPARMAAEHSFTLNEVHDPNNIIGQRAIYLKCICKSRKRVQYRLVFENDAKGSVKDASVYLPIREEFDAHTFDMISAEPVGDSCQGSHHIDSICYTQQISNQDIKLQFYNLGLLPRERGTDRKYSRATADFSIETRTTPKGSSKLKAFIDFLGPTGPEPTRNAVTRWRHRALYLKPGYSFETNVSHPYGIDSTGKRIQHWNPSVSMTYQNAPLGSGLIWGCELGLNRLQLFHRFDEKDPALNFHLEDKTNNWYLEAKAIGGYQVSPVFRLVAGGGIALPAWAHLVKTFNGSTNKYDVKDVKYGIFQSKEFQHSVDSGKTFMPTIDTALGVIPARLPGLVGQVGVEFGAMNFFVVGAEFQFHYFPWFYEKKRYDFDGYKPDQYLGKYDPAIGTIHIYIRFKIPVRKCKCGPGQRLKLR